MVQYLSGAVRSLVVKCAATSAMLLGVCGQAPVQDIEPRLQLVPNPVSTRPAGQKFGRLAAAAKPPVAQLAITTHTCTTPEASRLPRLTPGRY